MGRVCGGAFPKCMHTLGLIEYKEIPTLRETRTRCLGGVAQGLIKDTFRDWVGQIISGHPATGDHFLKVHEST